jgi:SH3-like domain-containing protein
VTRSVPWRRDRVGEARAQIEAADRQLADDHLGAAIFFASRARRTTEALRVEAQQVAEWSHKRVIRGDRVNLRAAPSETGNVVEVLARETPLYPERSFREWTLVRTPDGRVGWVHDTLLN